MVSLSLTYTPIYKTNHFSDFQHQQNSEQSVVVVVVVWLNSPPEADDRSAISWLSASHQVVVCVSAVEGCLPISSASRPDLMLLTADKASEWIVYFLSSCRCHWPEESRKTRVWMHAISPQTPQTKCGLSVQTCVYVDILIIKVE